MTNLQIIVAVFQSLWSLKNIRLAAIFKGQDYAQSEGDNPISAIEDPEVANNTAWFALPEEERTVLKNTQYTIPATEEEVEAAIKAGQDPFKLPQKKVSLKELTWDKWSLDEKVFYLELKKNNSIDVNGIPTKPAPTQCEEFLSSIENLKIDTGYLGVIDVGKYIGWATTPVINFLFSPTFLRIVSVGAAIGMLFSPFGYGVGALALTVALASVALDIYRYTAKYRELNSVKEENVLLNELKKEGTTLEHTLGKSTEAFRDIIATTMPGHGINPDREAPSLLRAAGYTIIGAYSNMVVSTTLSIATLNPIPILASMLMMVTGYSVTTSMYYQFDKRFTYLSNANAMMKAELGLEQGFGAGGRNMYLSEHLNRMRCYNLAVAKVATDPEASKANPNRDLLRQMLVNTFNQEMDLVGEGKKSPRPSFLEDAWTLLDDGVSWKDVNRRFTPSFMEEGVVKHHSTEAFAARREAGIKTMEEAREKDVSKHREKFNAVLAEIAKPQPEKEPIQEPVIQPTIAEKPVEVIAAPNQSALVETKAPNIPATEVTKTQQATDDKTSEARKPKTNVERFTSKSMTTNTR